MDGRCLAMAGVLVTVLAAAGLLQQASAEGCFWESRCQNRWIGGCGNSYVPVDMSHNCLGLCAEPQYPVCAPFFTRFQCCSIGKARESTSCNGCPNKVDLGEEWVCCSDCSDPVITDVDEKIGYCQTDAYLSVQPKPREIFKWITGDWKKCAGGCKKGVRNRDVKCLRYVEDSPKLPTVVDHDKCLAAIKPSTEERCTPQGCVGGHTKREGLPIWAIVLISLASVAAVGGLAFAGFVLYKRRTDNSNHGFVYVMLEGY